MQPSELAETTMWFQDYRREIQDYRGEIQNYNRELDDLIEELIADQQARLREPDPASQRLLAVREEIAEWRRESARERELARHEPVTSSDRSRGSRHPIRQLLRVQIRDVETSELISRNTEAFERFRESMDTNTAVLRELVTAAREQAKAARDQARSFQRQHEAMTVLVVELKQHGELLKYDRDALTGAFADLASEIRGWKNGR
jgi:chromosome segregation ATPase